MAPLLLGVYCLCMPDIAHAHAHKHSSAGGRSARARTCSCAAATPALGTFTRTQMRHHEQHQARMLLSAPTILLRRKGSYCRQPAAPDRIRVPQLCDAAVKHHLKEGGVRRECDVSVTCCTRAQAFERGGAVHARAHLQLCSSNSGARYLHAHANEAP